MKKTKIHILLIMTISLTLLIRPAGVNAQQVVNAEKFGLNQEEDATFPIQQALIQCKKVKAQKLIIPRGTYHFYPDLAYEQYGAISNHDNGLKRIGFPLIGLKDLEIDGNGSRFIFHGYMVPFLVEDSDDISLSNFSVDWDKPFHLQGSVIRVDSSNRSFQLKLSEENHYEVIGSELIFNVFGKNYTIQNNIWFNPETKATVYDVSSYKIDTWNPNIHLSYKAKDLGNHVVEIQHDVAKLPKKDWIFVAKGRTNGNRARYSPAIHINSSRNVDLENVDIYHAGGMGLIGEKSESISMTDFNVLLAPDRNRIISTTADATHFVNCKGQITFLDCTFENMLDDGTNVHGVYLFFERLIDSKTLEAKTRHYQQYGLEFAQAGDTLRIVDGNSLKPIQTLVLKDIDIFNEEYQHLVFDKELPPDLGSGSIIENLSWSPSVAIKNCKVWRNRARSLLVKVDKPVLIENCYFSSMMDALRIGSGGGGSSKWGESGPVTNVTIRNNQFVNNCTGSRNKPVISITPGVETFVDNFYYNENIVIENNTIEAFNHQILSATSTDKLVFRNNTILESTDFEPGPGSKPTLEFKHCGQVRVHGNRYKSKTLGSFYFDKHTSKSISIKNNKGFD